MFKTYTIRFIEYTPFSGLFAFLMLFKFSILIAITDSACNSACNWMTFHISNIVIKIRFLPIKAQFFKMLYKIQFIVRERRDISMRCILTKDDHRASCAYKMELNVIEEANAREFVCGDILT